SPFDRVNIGRTAYVDIDPQYRAGFEHVECLALRQAVNNVVEDDITQAAQEAQMGTSRADIAGTDKRNFLSLCHEDSRRMQLNSSQLVRCEDDKIAARAKAGQEHPQFHSDLTGTA